MGNFRSANPSSTWNPPIMAKTLDHHEHFDREEEVKGSSDRSLGFVFSGFFAIVAVLKWWHDNPNAIWWLVAAAVVLTIALIRPQVLGPLNKLWIRLGLVLYKVVNPIVMAFLFFVVIWPIALLMRLTGRRPLPYQFDPNAKSYWVPREPVGPAPDSLKNQF